jgi:hypothetical protein
MCIMGHVSGGCIGSFPVDYLVPALMLCADQ